MIALPKIKRFARMVAVVTKRQLRLDKRWLIDALDWRWMIYMIGLTAALVIPAMIVSPHI
jgi:hypothetical protein